MRRRLLALMMTLIVLFVGVGVRVYIVSQSGLYSVAVQQSTRRETVAVARGTIYDRYVQPLVNRSYAKQVSIAPFTSCVSLVEQQLKGTTRTKMLATLKNGDCATSEVEKWLSPTVGVTQLRVPIRYDRETLACHVIGYVDGENKGVCGVEKAFDEQLAFYSGQADIVYAVDALGRITDAQDPQLINTLSEAVGGVALTLDSEIQRIARQAAQMYLERGAVVITDVQSGEVLASVSMPMYEPQQVESVLADADAPLLDRTMTNYDLGSVFKIITAAAALESGMSVDTTYRCDGFTEIDGKRFYCHNPLGDGVQTMGQAMADSCNCYFIQLALDIGASAVYEMAVRAGFSEAVCLASDFETSAAILPLRRDLSADAALANFAIGQGDLLATPYHVAMLLGAVANDGVRCLPSLFYGTVDAQGVLRKEMTSSSDRLFSVKTAVELRAMLERVVAQGTGTAAGVARYQAAGKTGTAQTGWRINGEEVVQSWFAGYYPSENPQFVITVLSENGGVNGKTAAPLFAAVADELFYTGLVE